MLPYKDSILITGNYIRLNIIIIMKLKWKMYFLLFTYFNSKHDIWLFWNDVSNLWSITGHMLDF